MPAEPQNKILVVDDSQSVRRMLKEVLTSGGYDVLDAANGAEGLDTAKSNEVSLIITDVNMPVMNGLKMIQEIRKIDNYDDKPIFVLTTESSPQMMSEAKSNGATAFIVKPFRPAMLLKAVTKVLDGLCKGAS